MFGRATSLRHGGLLEPAITLLFSVLFCAVTPMPSRPVLVMAPAVTALPACWERDPLLGA